MRTTQRAGRVAPVPERMRQLDITLEEIEAARDALRAMLKDGAEPPDGLFWELRHLQPVREYPPRHISTMLAFDAAVEAMRKALGVA